MGAVFMLRFAPAPSLSTYGFYSPTHILRLPPL